MEDGDQIMTFSDETLMAYADGELDATTRHAVEAACARDATLARRVEQCKMRRANVFAGFAPGDEALGQRVRPQRQATVVSLDVVRARREASQQAARKAGRERRWSWREWSALAAVLVLGVVAGKFGLSYLQEDDLRADLVASRDGTLVAQGRLAAALEQQPSAARGAGPGAAAGTVRIAMSFVSTEGAYCRSFASGSGSHQIDGLACKTGQEWRIPVLVQNPRPATAGNERAAIVDAMPSQVELSIEQRMAGEALDAKAEQAAMQKAWQR
jgi:anti-sigma factor RsiW